MSDFRIEDHPVVFLKPRLSYPYAWVGHVPFAYLLIDLLRPRSLVELGTDSGNSYLAFCQAVVETGSDTRCTAIDSWEGDPHARRYGEGVYETLKQFHDPRYATFSRLLRSYFIDAVGEFADGSVDLLHIDGLHTYEAVSEDFNSWLPKLSDRAVVIFHDSQVRGRDFGVARFLDEIRGRYRVAEFEHSNGLGIAVVGANVPKAFLEFMDAFEQRPVQIRRFFQEVGDSLVTSSGQPGGARAEQVAPDVTCRIYYRDAGQEFDDSRVVMAELTNPQGLLALEFTFPEGVRPAAIRIDPADHAGTFTLSAMSFLIDGGRADATDLQARAGFVTGDLLPGGSPGQLRLVAFGEDPHVELAVGDLTERLPASGPLALHLTIDFEVVLNEPAFWPIARAQDEALAALKNAMEHRLSNAAAGAGGAGLASIATMMGAMSVAGILVLPDRGPSLYMRNHDDAFSANRRVRGEVIGLENAAVVSFSLAGQDNPPLIRLDVPAVPGTYQLSGLMIDGKPVDDLDRRVIAVRGTLLESTQNASLTITASDVAPYVELDISDIDAFETIVVVAARDLREPWAAAVHQGIVDAVEKSLLPLRAAIAEYDDVIGLRLQRIANGLSILDLGNASIRADYAALSADHASLRADNAQLRTDIAFLTQLHLRGGIIRRILRRLRRVLG